ncbi:MAG: VanZ family protein [Niabella sp.]|nr:VanZ family protein [Niabella sp.]
MKRKFILIIALIYFIVTVILLTLPGSDFPKADFLEKIHFDKWVHIGMFALLVFLWDAWLAGGKQITPFKKFIIVGVVALAYGILMEFVQKYWIPGRSFDVTDMAADGVGCIIGLLASKYLLRKK